MNIETIDLHLDDHGFAFDKPTVNFGPGIELLMNDKKQVSTNKNPSLSSDINLVDLQELEDDLNSLAQDNPSSSSSSARPAMSLKNKDYEFDNMSLQSNNSVNLNDDSKGLFSSDARKPRGDEKTWDGFQKFNNIPSSTSEPQNNNTQDYINKLSKEETMRLKFDCIKKLEILQKKGVEISKKYTMESSLLEMQGEYESIVLNKEKENSVKFQGKMLMACITGLEFLNNKFDPFDLKLDGWSDAVNENVDEYDEIFQELHEKYKTKAKMAPELKLLFQLGGSAIMLHMTNTMFKSAMPGMDDIMRQNPELMQQFTSAAVNQMGQKSPHFGNFMGNVMNQSSANPRSNSSSTSNNNNNKGSTRPDLDYAQQSNSNKGGVDLSDHYENPSSTVRSSRNMRPDMNGPSDISGILSGLKTKASPTMTTSTINNNNNNNKPDEGMNENVSTISIADLKDMQRDSPPKRGKQPRRQKSDKNTISLDI